MSDLMTFPNTVEEFMEKYKIVDTEHVYTNGVEMVPIFRMQQWFDHMEEGDLDGVEARDIARRASAKLVASYERAIVKLTEAIAEQAQNEGAKMT